MVRYFRRPLSVMGIKVGIKTEKRVSMVGKGAGEASTSIGTDLRPHVLVAWRADEREANQENVGLRVRQWAKTIVVLLTSSIPEGQLNMLSVDLYIGDVVLEHGGNIDLRGGRGTRER